MSTVLTLRRGMEYMKERRDQQTKQDKWDYYDGEYRRIQCKMYEKQYEKEMVEYENVRG
jgi:hypothetical protein|tara:strand:+ start:1961 stop:2137 length:177 start_codon:yes stop_codon:yes gene_type:complete